MRFYTEIEIELNNDFNSLLNLIKKNIAIILIILFLKLKKV